MQGKIAAAALLAGLSLGQVAHAAVKYSVTDLTPITGSVSAEWTSINNAGNLGGRVNSRIAATYIDGKLSTYRYVPSERYSEIYTTKLTNTGIFAFSVSESSGGYSHTGSHIVRNGVVTPLEPFGTTAMGLAIGINDSGKIAGVTDGGVICSPDGNCSPAPYAAMYENADAAPTLLGSGYAGAATAINNHGTVTGYVTMVDYSVKSFTYVNGTMQYLSLPYDIARAQAINDAGQIVGVGYADGKQIGWLLDQEQVVPLNTGYLTNVVDINGTGQIIGTAEDSSFHQYAWIRTNDEITLLDDLLANDAWTVYDVYDINDKGQILGQAMHQDGRRVNVLLTPDQALPVPEPATYAMLAVGLLLLGAWRRNARSYVA